MGARETALCACVRACSPITARCLPDRSAQQAPSSPPASKTAPGEPMTATFGEEHAYLRTTLRKLIDKHINP
jgi:hypothetical protein